MKRITISGSVWAACASARNSYFKKQIDKTVSVRTRSLEVCLEEKFPNYHLFGEDLKATTKLLLDSKRFNEECEELGLIAENVGQHIVFEGKDVFEAVRDNGIKAVLGSRVLEFNQPLYDAK
ncbi:hypothetical protein [uncultured Alistipes sp.]|jgi:hypothetical protein|uniref:hypothetical protein n=1 Tax=uncultured Alistipes sp. TaxID=538949 RepID=UPI0025F09140|nr:hypothetical protein [uncultured Alistipes sp.]